jgi:hypothetical protein
VRKLLLLTALTVAVSTACSPAAGPGGREQVVLKVINGLQVGGPAPMHEILDLGLPPIRNISDHTVRIRSVQIVSPPAAIHVLNIRAYKWRQVGFGWLQNAFGDLPKQCPREWKPHTVTAVVTGPHSNSNWMIVIALTIAKPGSYHLHKVKISYIADGQEGWQYQNFDTKIRAFRGHFPGGGC